MKKILIYLASLALIIVIFIFAKNYRQTPPIYYVVKYNFEKVQKALLKPTDEDIDKMNDYFYSRNSYPKRNDSLKYKILDSITNAKFGSRIEDIVIENKGNPMLLITYSYPARYGRQSYTIRVPIPPGEMEKAQEVALSIADLAK